MKTHIRMVVQEKFEPATIFAERLEAYCDHLKKDTSIFTSKVKFIKQPSIVAVTSASDGRQTATIQFITEDTI